MRHKVTDNMRNTTPFIGGKYVTHIKEKKHGDHGQNIPKQKIKRKIS